MKFLSKCKPFSGFALILLTQMCLGQNNYQVTTVQATNTYSLNAASTVFGNPRTSVRIALPQNTIAWFYVVTVSKGSGQSTTLVSQLNKLMGISGLTGSIVTQLLVPKGDAKCDVYIVDQNNNDLFLYKKEFTYFREGSAKSVSEAKMDIRNLNNDLYYLVLYNPELYSIKVTVEVAAIVSSKSYGSTSGNRVDWQGENGTRVVNIIKTKTDTHLIWDKLKLIGTASAVDELKECVAERIISAYSLSSFLNLNSVMIDYEVMTKYKECLPNFLYTETYEEQRASLYGSLGWKAYVQGEIDKAIKLTEQSLQITPLFWVQANRAFFYLLQGQEAQGIEAYMKSLDVLEVDRNPKIKKSNHIKGCLKDIENVAYKSIKGSEEARTILNKALSWCE